MKKMKKCLITLLTIFVVYSCFAFAGMAVAHTIVFSRAEYKAYDSTHYLLYEEDVDHVKYPRETLTISSGNHKLTGFLYGADNKRGLIVLSPGHRDANDIKLYETLYFVDAGFCVLCYDYTGCYNSEGGSMVGYTQSYQDLDAVLTYVEASKQFDELPLYLFGHSLGGYATGMALPQGHRVEKAIIASPLNTAEEQWQYSIERFTGFAYPILKPYNALFIKLKYGDEATKSVISGINSVSIPVMVISGEEEDYYGGESCVYRNRDQVTNPNCTFILMNQENHNGHYNYLLTDAALEYQDSRPSGTIDKELYMQHDPETMKMFTDFFDK